MGKIALADDHIPTLKRFKEFINKITGYSVVLEAENGHELISKIAALSTLPDIVFIDINMPVIEGVAVTYYLRVHYPYIKIIALSSYTEENIVKKILLSGANGFIFKALAESILLEAIENIQNGNTYIDSRIQIEKKEITNILLKQKEYYKKTEEFGLTMRERTFVMLNATSLSYFEIAETMFVEIKTIQTYFDRISKKLNIKNRHELALFSLQNRLAMIADYN